MHAKQYEGGFFSALGDGDIAWAENGTIVRTRVSDVAWEGLSFDVIRSTGDAFVSTAGVVWYASRSSGLSTIADVVGGPVAYSDVDDVLFVGGGSEVVAYSVERGVHWRSSTNGPVLAIDVADEAAIVAAVMDSPRELLFLDAGTGELVARVPFTGDASSPFVISPDGTFAAAAGLDVITMFLSPSMAP